MNSINADWILHDGNVYPSTDATPITTSMAIWNGWILAVGSPDEVRQYADRTTREVSLTGLTVLPGLIDGHIHLEKYSLSLDTVDCATPSLETLLHRIEEKAASLEKGTWILGHGWDQNLWGRYGKVDELDRIAPLHPVYLTAKSLHAGWVNTEAIRRANIRVDTPDPPDGVIERTHQGELTGILYEGAMSLLSEAIPAPDPQTQLQQMRNAQGALWKVGITGVHDFDGPNCLRSLQRLRQDGLLGLRVLKNFPWKVAGEMSAVGIQTGFGDEWIRIGGLKIFSDGALGPRTAAMLDPYIGEPENLGLLLLDSEEIYERGVQAAEAGIGLTVHAIGDRANHEVLNAYESLRNFEVTNNLKHHRHRIEHVQLLHKEDLSRLATLDLIASMQPIHAVSDMEMADAYWGSRVSEAYAWRTQLEFGATLVFGSDAPVENPNPFLGLHAALTRRRLDGKPGVDGWTPSQRISLKDSLNAYTLGPAFAAGLEKIQGKLLPGYLADLIVLKDDLFQVEVDELADMLPVATMVGGEWRSGELDGIEVSGSNPIAQ